MGAACESEHTEYGRCSLPAGHSSPHTGYSSGEWHDPKPDPYEQAANALDGEHVKPCNVLLTPEEAELVIFFTDNVAVAGESIDHCASLRRKLSGLAKKSKRKA